MVPYSKKKISLLFILFLEPLFKFSHAGFKVFCKLLLFMCRYWLNLAYNKNSILSRLHVSTFIGHLQALWENRSKSYLYFNALWDL